MGKRSRKRRDPAAPPKPRPAATTPAPRVSRSEARNAAARAQLQPLAPGERPRAVVAGAAVTVFAAAANVIAYAAGLEIQGKRPAVVGILAFTALMLTMAWGLWNARYWAVLGLEALLGLLIVILSLFLLRAENVKSALIVLAIVIPAGALFWFNVKAMARIQMPERPERRG